MAKQRARLTLVFVTLGNLFIAMSYSLQAPFFPQEATKKGLTPTQFGFVFGVFQLTVFIFSPIAGKLIVALKPKMMLNSGIILVGVSNILFGFLAWVPGTAAFFWPAVTIRVLEGLGTAFFQTAAFAVVVAVSPDRVATSFSIVETAWGVGVIVGPTLGGALYQAGGFILPFQVVGGLVILCAIVIGFCQPPIEEGADSGASSGNMLKFWRNPGVVLYATLVFVTFVIIGFNVSTLELHLEQFQLQPVLLGLVFVVSGGTYALTTPIFGRLADHGVNARVLCLVGVCLHLTSMILIGPLPIFNLSTMLWLVILSLVIHGLGISGVLVSAFVGTLQDTLRRGFPDNLATHGLVSSLFTTSQSLGAFVGPTLGGFLLERQGYRPASMDIAGLAAVTALLLLAYILWERCGSRESVKTEGPEESRPILASSSGRHYSFGT